MSFNVGSGLMTARISDSRLDAIKNHGVLPELSWWEKIKDFFFSTHQQQAFNCLYRLCNHRPMQLSERDIQLSFEQLRSLASPGCTHKFILEKTHDEIIWRIEQNILLSLPYRQRASDHCSAEDIWHDCAESDATGAEPSAEDDIWYDCQERAEDVLPEPDTDLVFISREESLPDQHRISIMNRVNKAPEASDYIESINALFPEMEATLLQLGRMNIIRKLGLANAVRANKIGIRIAKNISRQTVDLSLLKSDIKKLLAIPHLQQLIPERVVATPQFELISRG